MPLVQEPTKIITDPRKYITCVYGRPGVGKTDWAKQIPGHYFLMCEPGCSGVSVYGHETPTWDSVRTACNEIAQGKAKNWEGQRPIEVVVFDTYDALWRGAGEYIIANETFIHQGKAAKYQKVGDVPYSKDYKRINEVVMGMIVKLKLMGLGVVILAHAKTTKIKWQGQEMDYIGIDGSESMENALSKDCDCIGYAMVDETVKKNDKGEVEAIEHGRYIYWQPTYLRLAKHRYDNFPEKVEMPKGKGWEIYCDKFKDASINASK